MKKRIDKVSGWELIVLALISVGLFAFMNRSKQTTRAEDYDARFAAARLSDSAFTAIRDYRKQAGLILDEINDPNRTGLIGTQYSLITVGRGDQTGVLTATNPNFVAVVLALLRKAGLKTGDAVAVGLSGSVPALDVEVLAACKVLGLNPIPVAAISSSMWGANDPAFTWLDIEALLNQRGILPGKSAAASLGGDDDNGRGLSPVGRALLDSAAARNHLPLIEATNLAEAVSRRMDAYHKVAGNRPIRAFINVGNSLTNLGTSDRPLPSGILDRRPAQLPAPSVMRSMAEQGAVLINLVDITRLAYRNGFPVAPVPLPPLGKGRMYLERRYPVIIALVFAVIIVLLLLLVIEYDLDFYVRRMFGLPPRVITYAETRKE